MTNHAIPPQAVDVAVRAFYGAAWDDYPPEDLKYALYQMRETLEAAAPYIRAEAIEDVATELDGADRVTRERDGYTATINLPNAAIYLRRRAAAERPNT